MEDQRPRRVLCGRGDRHRLGVGGAVGSVARDLGAQRGRKPPADLDVGHQLRQADLVSRLERVEELGDRRAELAVPAVELASGLPDERPALERGSEHVLGFGLSVAPRRPARIVELVANSNLLPAHRICARHQAVGEQVGRGPDDANAVALLADEVETERADSLSRRWTFPGGDKLGGAARRRRPRVHGRAALAEERRQQRGLTAESPGPAASGRSVTSAAAPSIARPTSSVRVGHPDRRLTRLWYNRPVRLLVLDRYIVRELVSPLAFGCALLTFFLVIDRIYQLTDLVITKGVPFFLVVQLLVFMLPSFLAHTLPMALLSAVLLAGGRLASDFEIVAFRAAGVSALRLFRPVLLASIVVALATAGLTLGLNPVANLEFQRQLFRILQARAPTGLQEP